MASLFRDGQRPSQEVLRIIVDHLKGVARPEYLGIVSLEIGWSLARTQEMFDLLVARGDVRPVSAEEKEALRIPLDANVYVLTDVHKKCTV